MTKNYFKKRILLLRKGVKQKITIDIIIKSSMAKNKYINYLSKSKHLIKFIYKNLKIKNPPMTPDIWTAFKVSRDQLYPNPKKDWELISARQSVKVLDGRVSLYNILKLLKQGIFRVESGKIYKEEVELLKMVLDLKDIFIKSGTILPTEDVNGREVFAIIPKSIDKLKSPELNQELVSLKTLLNHPFGKIFIEELTK